MSIIIIFIENTELVLRECLRNRLAHNATQKKLLIVKRRMVEVALLKFCRSL